jgi:hypothetical protein
MEEGKIIKTERGGEVVTNEALETYKSMYYLFKGKRDTEIKLFDEGKKFKRSDLIELNQKIQNKLHNHTVHSDVTNITVTLSNKEIKDYGSWVSFEDKEWHQSAMTHSIVIEWDVNLQFPNQFSSIPQTHTIRLRIGSGLRPNELFQVVMSGGEDFEIGEVMSEMVCKIDFVNNHICNELQGIVSDWYAALPLNEPTNAWIKRCGSHRGKIELFINFLFLSTVVFILNIIFVSLIPYLSLSSNVQVTKWVFASLTITFPILYVCMKVSNFYSERVIDKTIRRFRRNPMIELTRGDLNKIAEVKRENNKLLKDLAMKITVTIIFNVGCWIGGQFLPSIVEKIAKFYLEP